MEYNWDKEKLKALKKDLITFRKQYKYLFPEEKQVIKTYLIWIKELEDRLYLPKEKYFSLNWPIRYVDKEKFLPKYTLDDYRSIPKNIRKLILNSTHTLHFFEDNYEGIELPKTKLSDNDFIELSHDFFDWLPNKKYKKIASKFLDKNRNLLRIEKEKQLQNYYGLTYPFYYPRYLPYILVSKKRKY